MLSNNVLEDIFKSDIAYISGHGYVGTAPSYPADYDHMCIFTEYLASDASIMSAWINANMRNSTSNWACLYKAPYETDTISCGDVSVPDAQRNLIILKRNGKLDEYFTY